MGNNKKQIFYILAIVLSLLAVYGITCKYGFINWDDDINVFENPAFFTANPIKTLWASFTSYSYLPVSYTMMYLQYHYTKSPQVMHCVNVILHCVNVVLIFFVLKKLRLGVVVAFWAALIYGVHPMRVETVAWISEQKGLWAGFFGWMSVLFYTRYKEKENLAFFVSSMALYTLAVFSKQTAMPFCLVFFLMRYFVFEENIIRKNLWESVAVAVVGYSLTMTQWVCESRHFLLTSAENLGVYDRFINSAKCFMYYILKTFLPFNVYQIYPKWQNGVDFTADVLPAIAVAAVFVVAIKYFLKNRDDLSARLTVFSLFAYFFTILPVLGIFTIPYMNTTYVTDRYSYFSGVFIVLFLVLFIEKRIVKLSHYIFAFFCVVFGLFSVSYVMVWEKPDVFWRYLIKNDPSSDTAYVNLSYFYMHKPDVKKEDIKEASFLSQKAIASNPKNALGWYNYGSCMMLAGNYSEAEKYFKQALVVKPEYADIWNDLGFVALKKGDLKSAERYYKRALEYNSNHAVAKKNLVELMRERHL